MADRFPELSESDSNMKNKHGDSNDKIIIELGYCKISIVISQFPADQLFAEAEG